MAKNNEDWLKEFLKRVEKGFGPKYVKMIKQSLKDTEKEKKKEESVDPKKCPHNELEFDNGGSSLTCVKCNLRYVVSIQHQPYFNVKILAKEKRGNGRKE